MNQFFKLYKFLFEDEEYKSLSIESKVVYSIMIDRNELSIKNNLIDDSGQVYIFMKIEEIQKIFNCSNKTAIKSLKELEKIGLIKIEKQGGNRSNKIFIKTFDKCKNYTLGDVENTRQRCKKYTSEDVKNTPNDVKKVHTIKTNINKTEYNKTDINNKSGALAPDKETVFQIPLKDGSYYNLNKQDVDTYKSLYPNIDIEQEIRNIIGWNIANPSKRKTKKGIKKHINTWLSSSNQNKGGVSFGKHIKGQVTSNTESNKPTAEDFRRIIQSQQQGK